MWAQVALAALIKIVVLFVVIPVELKALFPVFSSISPGPLNCFQSNEAQSFV